jgi:hypothetical protein
MGNGQYGRTWIVGAVLAACAIGLGIRGHIQQESERVRGPDVYAVLRVPAQVICGVNDYYKSVVEDRNDEEGVDYERRR